MAIEIDELKTHTDTEEAVQTLTRHTDNFGLFFDLDRMLEYTLNFSRKINMLAPMWRKLGANEYLKPTADRDIISTLIKRFGVPKYKFENRDEKISYNDEIRTRLLNDGSIDEAAKKFITMSIQLKDYTKIISAFDQYMKLPVSEAYDINGHRMTIGNPKWVLLNTGRIGAATPSVQNIDKRFADIVTCPDGWIMMRADSGQIEPRITYSYFIRDELIINLIHAYRDAYFGITHFVFLTEEEEVKLRNDFSNFVKWSITDEQKAKRQQTKKLVLSANYGSALKSVEPNLANAFMRKIVNHPARIEWENKVKDQVARGNETFYSAFGTPIIPGETAKYKKGTPEWVGHVERCGINNPIQATAADLMNISVAKADEILSQTENSHIAFYKHDEGAFYVQEKDRDILKDLEGVTAYNVKGWVEIENEVEYGILPGAGIQSYIKEWKR